MTAYLKLMLPGLDNFERKHYESKITKLDSQIAEIQDSGEHITMD